MAVCVFVYVFCVFIRTGLCRAPAHTHKQTLTHTHTYNMLFDVSNKQA